jgi:hypothetical protein
MKKYLLIAAAVATLAMTGLASTGASAHWFGGGWGHHHWGWGGPHWGGGWDYSPCSWSPYPYPHEVCEY